MCIRDRFNGAKDVTSSYHLKFHRNDIQGTGDDGWKNRGGDGLKLIAPYEDFYNTCLLYTSRCV